MGNVLRIFPSIEHNTVCCIDNRKKSRRCCLLPEVPYHEKYHEIAAPAHIFSGPVHGIR